MSLIDQMGLQDKEIKRLQLSIAYVTIILSSFAICLTCVFFAFNIRYRNFRLIKMSSPNINNIINFNCVILYLCPIFNSIKGLNIHNELIADSMCQVNTWFLPMSSTIIYAAMLAKAWRIFKIFETTPKMKKIVIKDIRLVAYIFFLVVLDVCILTVWQILDPVKLRARYVYENTSQPSQIIFPSSFLTKNSIVSSLITSSTNANTIQNTTSSFLDDFSLISDSSPEIPETSQPIVQNFSQTTQLKVLFECNSNLFEVWITILTMYKIILLMYGIYLAWIIRNINVPSMNDSKYLLLSTYAIIVCGLGSMSLMQILRDWPDVVQAFFTIGIILATCTTQCLLFIPKIRLWFKRKNDDNFKISLSQIFLQSNSSCYYTDKHSKNPSNPATGNMLNLEDELCELLHENSQLKNYLKEKEEIIKLLQEKIRMTKANLFQANEQQNLKDLSIKNEKNDSGIDIDAAICGNSKNANNSSTNSSGVIDYGSSNENFTSYNFHIENKTKTNKNGFDIDSSTCTTNTASDTIKLVGTHFIDNKPKLSDLKSFSTLKNDLDEVEELTSRVRDSISIDLLNTRRYSPLLYEYYRKHLELAKSIQCTYNIQCNSLFDAMTLMRKCLRDYCQTVHNPEYLAFDTIHSDSNNHFSFNDYIKKNNLSNENHSNQQLYQSNTLPQFTGQLNSNTILNQGFSQRLYQMSVDDNSNSNLNSNSSINSTAFHKMILPTNPFLVQTEAIKTKSINERDETKRTTPKITQNNEDTVFTNRFNNNLCEETTSSSAVSTASSSILKNTQQHNTSTSNLITSQLNTFETKKISLATIDNKQTYV